MMGTTANRFFVRSALCAVGLALLHAAVQGTPTEENEADEEDEQIEDDSMWQSTSSLEGADTPATLSSDHNPRVTTIFSDGSNHLVLHGIYNPSAMKVSFTHKLWMAPEENRLSLGREPSVLEKLHEQAREATLGMTFKQKNSSAFGRGSGSGNDRGWWATTTTGKGSKGDTCVSPLAPYSPWFFGPNRALVPPRLFGATEQANKLRRAESFFRSKASEAAMPRARIEEENYPKR